MEENKPIATVVLEGKAYELYPPEFFMIWRQENASSSSTVGPKSLFYQTVVKAFADAFLGQKSNNWPWSMMNNGGVGLAAAESDQLCFIIVEA